MLVRLCVQTLQLSKILIRTRIWPVSRQQILIRTMPKAFEDFGQNLIRIGYGLSKNLKNLIRTGIWHSAVLSGVLWNCIEFQNFTGRQQTGSVTHAGSGLKLL